MYSVSSFKASTLWDQFILSELSEIAFYPLLQSKLWLLFRPTTLLLLWDFPLLFSLSMPTLSWRCIFLIKKKKTLLILSVFLNLPSLLPHGIIIANAYCERRLHCLPALWSWIICSSSLIFHICKMEVSNSTYFIGLLWG